jgi:outer membrane protein assembly factor BamD
MKELFSFRFPSLNIIVILLLALALGPLAGCAKMKGWRDSGGDLSAVETLTTDQAEELAREGLDDFNHGRYSAALESFEKLRQGLPFTRYSLLAELKIADCNYHLKRYEEALVLYEEFERNHPTNEAIPYVLFQIGMSHSQQISSIDRNPKGASEAIQAFSRLLRTFPASPYTEEATVRIQASRDFLAAHELYVANFYIRTKSYGEAESRLDYLLSNFPDTSSVGEAEELQEALRSGNPPRPPWHSWLPLPRWLNPFSS